LVDMAHYIEREFDYAISRGRSSRQVARTTPPPPIRRAGCNPGQRVKKHSRSALEGTNEGGRRSMAELFMLFVFGISAGSAVAALHARHQQYEVGAEARSALERLRESL
jgi:hypothetical protein